MYENTEIHLRPSVSGAVLSLLTAITLLAAGCGGPATGSEGGSADASSGGTGVDVSSAKSPEEVGDAVAALYVGALERVGEALTDQPAPEEARQRLKEIEKATVEDMVTLGRRIEEMAPADQSTVESAVSRAQTDLRYDPEKKPIWEQYQAVQGHYIDVAGEHPELWKTLQNFNVITQYAFFDLLRRQRPEEAERLGV